MIKIEIDDSEVIAALNRLLAASANLRPAYYDIGEFMVDSTKRRFALGVDPDGQVWAELSDITAARKGHGKPLVGESRRLGTEIHPLVLGNGVEIGSPMEYAATMQFGAAQGAFGKSGCGGPIPWGDIPPRPFLGIGESDKVAILDIINEHLARAVQF